MSELRVTTLKHESAAADNITLDANGNVGIGTSSPNNLVQIEGSNGTVPSQLRLGITASSQFYDIGRDYTDGYCWFYGAQTGIYSGFKWATGGTERMRIDSAGRVTMPYQPSFYAQHNPTSATSGSYGNFTNEFINIGNHVSHSTHGGAYSYTRFTCPVAGIYLVWVGNIGPSAATVQRTHIYKNGVIASAILRSSQDGNHGTSASMTVLVNASAGDWIAAFSLADNGGVGFYASEYSHFGVRLLG